jgi:hypothetical protein
MATAPQPSRTHPPLAFDIGDDWFIEVECKSADGSPMDIRGAAVEWKLTDATGAAVLTLTAADGGVSIENDTGGSTPPFRVMVHLLPAQTSLIKAGRYTDRTKVWTNHGIVSTQVRGEIEARAS